MGVTLVLSDFRSFGGAVVFRDQGLRELGVEDRGIEGGADLLCTSFPVHFGEDSLLTFDEAIQSQSELPADRPTRSSQLHTSAHKPRNDSGCGEPTEDTVKLTIQNRLADVS